VQRGGGSERQQHGIATFPSILFFPMRWLTNENKFLKNRTMLSSVENYEMIKHINV
jgi:hypothetical protein